MLICMSEPASARTSLRGGNQSLSTFAGQLDLPEDFCTRVGDEKDQYLAEAIEWMQTQRPPKQNFWPALCLAFVAQAETALAEAGQDTDDDPFVNFPIELSAAGRPVNTLNFTVNGTKVPLRPRFNYAADVIRVDMRRDHPSAPAHATQAWPAYRPLVEMIFSMTPAARTIFAKYIWATGVVAADERKWASKAERIVRPFEKVLADFDTSNATPGGALFQSLIYGYFTADSPGLTLESHPVNVGSGRVDMPGDVAGFRGNEVELAVEVKDYAITIDTVESVLVDFLEDLVETPNATAVVVADDVDDGARERLVESNVIALSRDELRERVVTWDLPKQQEALRGAVYFLSRIQKKTQLVDKLVGFLTEEGIDTGILDQPTLTGDEADGNA